MWYDGYIRNEKCGRMPFGGIKSAYYTKLTGYMSRDFAEKLFGFSVFCVFGQVPPLPHRKFEKVFVDKRKDSAIIVLLCESAGIGRQARLRGVCR